MDEDKDKDKATAAINTFQDDTTRRWITLSYWTVILCCLPYWWISTTIERHELPLDEIAAWQARGDCPGVLAVELAFSTIASDATTTSATNARLIEALNNASRDRRLCLDFRISHSSARDATINIQWQDAHQVTLDADSASNNLRLPSDDLKGATNRILEHVLPGGDVSASKKAVKYSRKLRLVFSLLNEDVSKGGFLDWDVQEALRTHIHPLLHAAARLHHFDIETQIQYYAPLTIDVLPGDGVSLVPQDQIPAFINFAEWNLASSVSTDSVIHFLAYIPSSERGQLLLQKDGKQEPLSSFLIPQWGGVYVHSSGPQEDAFPIHRAFPIFHEQLKQLLGLRGTANSVNVAALTRQRVVQSARESVDRLGAIARQVTEIKNMRIPKGVREDVDSALRSLEQVGRGDLSGSMKHAADALDAVMHASFHHEMLAMLYFPDEHKWAVYTPLFGPIAVPLLVALLREIREWRRKRRETSIAAGQKDKTE